VAVTVAAAVAVAAAAVVAVVAVAVAAVVAVLAVAVVAVVAVAVAVAAAGVGSYSPPFQGGVAAKQPGWFGKRRTPPRRLRRHPSSERKGRITPEPAEWCVAFNTQ
jgi:hypothetical protein